MQRCIRLSVGLVIAFALTGRDVHAQWGHDGWGFMGWAPATPESAELQSAGIFAMGAGIYNLKTAQANNIDAQTAMKFNDYVADVTRESARIHAERVNRQIAGIGPSMTHARGSSGRAPPYAISRQAMRSTPRSPT